MWKCRACDEGIADKFDACWSCGASRDESGADGGDGARQGSPARAGKASNRCPECDSPTRSIKIVDQAGEAGHSELHYAAVGAQKSMILGRFELAGAVTAKMCTSCGRILLYGKPNRRR